MVTHASSFTVSLTCRGRFWHYLRVNLGKRQRGNRCWKSSLGARGMTRSVLHRRKITHIWHLTLYVFTSVFQSHSMWREMHEKFRKARSDGSILTACKVASRGVIQQAVCVCSDWRNDCPSHWSKEDRLNWTELWQHAPSYGHHIWALKGTLILDQSCNYTHKSKTGILE